MGAIGATGDYRGYRGYRPPAPRRRVPQRWPRTAWGGGRAGGGSPRVGASPRGGGSPCRPPPPPRSPALQRRPARVTVKYNRRELQRRLDTELWIDRRLAELYRGREGEMPDEVNIDDLLELEADEERAQRLQGILHSCTGDTEGFIQELLVQLKGLPKQQVLQRPSPEDPNPPLPVTPP
ncbi:protein phosphatase 1 regulatory subunit 14A-like, partial [Falco rusticolus]|uniref:protein phosphatase 1 regulatory subunit 14A-like n=1 Tax=Falco rusticolus TaxID=120794 RepID=UPI0018868CD8